MRVLKTYKDEIGSLSSIVAVFAIIFGAWQFYLAREALQAQAIGESLANGRDLYNDLADNPDIAADLFGSPREMVDETVFVQKVLSFFSEQQVYRDGWLFDEGTWNAIRSDMCRSYSNRNFKKIAERLLQSGSYPRDFVKVMEGC